MTKTQLGKWLFIYFLSVTVILGFVIIVFGKPTLRIDDTEGVLYILAPTFIGQITIIFKWFVSRADGRVTTDSKPLNIPVFLVKGPVIFVFIMFIALILLKYVGFQGDFSWSLSDTKFKGVVTLGMSILNATTFIFVGKIFEK